VADQYVSVPTTLSDLERQDMRVIIQANLLNNSRTVWPRTTKFGWITLGGVFLWGQQHPYHKVAEPKHFKMFGVPLYMYLCIHPLKQNYQIWCLTHMGGGACF